MGGGRLLRGSRWRVVRTAALGEIQGRGSDSVDARVVLGDEWTTWTLVPTSALRLLVASSHACRLRSSSRLGCPERAGHGDRLRRGATEKEAAVLSTKVMTNEPRCSSVSNS